MIKVKIIKKGYGHSPGQELSLNEFEAGHLMAFGFAVPFIEGRETQMTAPTETRIDHAHNPENIIIEPKPEPVSIFKRRGRRKK